MSKKHSTLPPIISHNATDECFYYDGNDYNFEDSNNKNKNVVPNFDKSKAVDVDFVVRLNDNDHPEKTRYNCQFSM